MYTKHWQFAGTTGSLIISESSTPNTVVLAITGTEEARIEISEAQFKELAALASYRYGSDYVRFQAEPEQPESPPEAP